MSVRQAFPWNIVQTIQHEPQPETRPLPSATMQLAPELEQLQAIQCTFEVEADHATEPEDKAPEYLGHGGNKQERHQQQCRRESGGADALFPQCAGQPRLDDAPSIDAGDW